MIIFLAVLLFLRCRCVFHNRLCSFIQTSDASQLFQIFFETWRP